ncbi:hypothetical protein Tco_0281603 [Tanacetum coccineum]
MGNISAQQIALDNALVAPEKQVEIGKCNMRIDYENTQKEPTYQVQFWATLNKHDSSYRFKIDKKRFSVDMEVFREILPICPRLPVLDFQIRNLMNLLLKKKFSPSSRNLAILEILRISMSWLLIICINHGELFLQSSTSV